MCCLTVVMDVVVCRIEIGFSARLSHQATIKKRKAERGNTCVTTAAACRETIRIQTMRCCNCPQDKNTSRVVKERERIYRLGRSFRSPSSVQANALTTRGDTQ